MHHVIKHGEHSIYSISADFRGFKTNITPEKIYLKNQNKKVNYYSVTSIAYNEGRNEYLMKISNGEIARFDMNFVEITPSLVMKDDTKLTSQNLNSLKGFCDEKDNKYIGQSIYADCSYIYSVYNTYETKWNNFISVFDYNGNYIKTLDLSSKIKGSEIEEIYCYNGIFYAAANKKKDSKNGFSIYKLKIKDTNKFDISYLDIESSSNIYQTVITGDEDHTTKLLSINSINSSSLIKLSNNKDEKKLIGYKAYRDYNHTWRMIVDGETKWLSNKEIIKARKLGKKVDYKLYKPTGSVYHTVKGGNSVLMIAQWENKKYDI